MLKFRKEKVNDDIIEFRYYPEGKNCSGIITMSHNAVLISKIIAANDETEWYAGHMMSRMREMIKLSDFPEQGIVAWY